MKTQPPRVFAQSCPTRGASLLGGLAWLAGTCNAADARERELDFHDLRPVESGHRGYYELRKDEVGSYVHAHYRVGDDATKLALVIPDADRAGRHRLTWRWRALVLPRGGDECDPRKTDSAASVYVAWRRGLRWYGLKYSWSAVSPDTIWSDDLRLRTSTEWSVTLSKLFFPPFEQAPFRNGNRPNGNL